MAQLLDELLVSEGMEDHFENINFILDSGGGDPDRLLRQLTKKMCQYATNDEVSSLVYPHSVVPPSVFIESAADPPRVHACRCFLQHARALRCAGVLKACIRPHMATLSPVSYPPAAGPSPLIESSTVPSGHAAAASGAFLYLRWIPCRSPAQHGIHLSPGWGQGVAE